MSALIHAATMVNAGVVLVARIGPIFYFAMEANPALIQPFFLTVAWIGAITAFLMATQGMVGFELKKILAYSTASQIGYMIMALGITGLSSNFAEGLSAALFQLMSHAIFKACLFMAAGVLIHVTGTKYVNGMGGLKDKMKLTFAFPHRRRLALRHPSIRAGSGARTPSWRPRGAQGNGGCSRSARSPRG